MQVRIDRPVRAGFLLAIGAWLAGILLALLLSVVRSTLAALAGGGGGHSIESLLMLFAFLCVVALVVAVALTRSIPATGPRGPSSE